MSQEKISELIVSLGLDSSNFENSIKSINKTTSSMEKSFNNAKKALELSEQGFDDYEKTIKAGQQVIEQYGKKMDALSNKYKEQENKLKSYIQQKEELPSAISKAESKLQELENTLDKTSQEYKEQENELKQLKQQYNNIDSTIDKSIGSLRSIENQMETVENRTQSVTKEVEDMNTAMKNIKADKLKEVGSKVTDLGEGVKGAGEKLVGLSTVLSGIGIASGTYAYTLEQGLAKVGTLVGKSGSEMSEYEDKVKDICKTLGIETSELTESWYSAVSAGVDFGTSLEFVESAGKLAVAGFTDTASSIGILTTALNVYGDKAGSADEIANKLLLTQNKGVTTVDELASAMGGALSIGGAYGVTFDNVATAFAKVTTQGRTTGEAGTQITRVLEELGEAGSKAGDIIKYKNYFKFYVNLFA